MKPTLKIIVASSILALILNVLFGRFITAKLSTWPFLNRFNILSPQAPIVINNREEIRLVDNGQFNDAVNSAKSKISSVLIKEGENVKWVGAALNLTSDGKFVAARDTFLGKGEFWVLLQDGRLAKISSSTPDPASGLVFFTAELNNISIASLGDSKSLASGEKILYFNNLLDREAWQASSETLVRPENSRASIIFTAGVIGRKLSTASTPQTGVCINIKGEVMGLVVSDALVPADVIKSATGLYLSNQVKISRPDFDFNYINLSQAEAEVLQLPLGAKVVFAEKASLIKAGDIILEVKGQKIDPQNFLEETLEQFKVGEEITFKVARGEQILDLTIKPKELK